MSEQEIIDGNKLIAEFMGMDIDTYPSKIPKHVSIWGNPYSNHNIMLYEYHSDWSWLMPVVEKITPMAKIDQQIWFDTKYALIDADIKVVYSRIIDFIKWYNLQIN